MESDHKLLEWIQYKNIVDASAHLQHLQGCDATVTYGPGKELLLAYTPSCYESQPEM